MPKPLRVAGEVDSWCTRCRLLLNHRIVSMNRARPHQVECLTCRSTHIWRPSAPGTKSSASAPREGASSRGASSAAARISAATRHERQWEQAIAGRGVREFKTYSVAESFAEGDLVRHKKFGDGLVTRIIDAKKVEVLFRDEARTLAQGLST
jgi:hypothetical protein